MNYDIKRIKALIKATPDFPEAGILFQDIFPLFQDPTAVKSIVTHIVHHILSTCPGKVDVIVGLDARGFLLGPWVAAELNAAFVPVRKGGKLPGKCLQVSYDLEYGSDCFQMQRGSIKAGQQCIILDDLLATGGSAKAASELITLHEGVLIKNIFIIELLGLKGRDRLPAPTYSLVQFDE